MTDAIARSGAGTLLHEKRSPNERDEAPDERFGQRRMTIVDDAIRRRTLARPCGHLALHRANDSPAIVATAEHDMAVRVTGVEMIDRDPVEPRSEIFSHGRAARRL